MITLREYISRLKEIVNKDPDALDYPLAAYIPEEERYEFINAGPEVLKYDGDTYEWSEEVIITGEEGKKLICLN